MEIHEAHGNPSIQQSEASPGGRVGTSGPETWPWWRILSRVPAAPTLRRASRSVLHVHGLAASARAALWLAFLLHSVTLRKRIGFWSKKTKLLFSKTNLFRKKYAASPARLHRFSRYNALT
jgi:hypothetical protein